jgi:hypothetical protein
MADAMSSGASNGTPLSVDQATLDSYTADTNLAGRAVIDPSLSATVIAGRTDGLTGIVHISPDAFADEGVLETVIFHEGVHVDQLSSGNLAWLQSSPAHLVNEVEAYRASIDYALANYNPAMSDYVVTNIDQLLYDLDQLSTTMGANGGAYYQNVTAASPNYTLAGSDVCAQCARP